MNPCSACGTALVAGANFCFKCGAPQPSAAQADPLLGKVVGNYRILSALGQGAMGKVYRAEQINLGRPVCIKTLLPHFSGEQTLVQRFEREARSVSGLHHPNIVGVFDFGRTPDGTLYIAMELVEGRSLRAVIEKESPLPLERVFTIIDQILSALEEAHGAGVIHRDLKPENVLVGHLRDGSDLIKVVDFGIAKVVNPDANEPRLTGTGIVCGTPGYMAPEQISGDAIDARTDVYAAGVILFELLTGRAPFGGRTLQELLRAHLTGTPPSPSSISKLPLPAALDLAVLRALANQRDRRFSSALELKRSLELVRVSLRSPAPAPGPAPLPLTAEAGPACPKCGHREPAGRKFCGECGAPIAAERERMPWDTGAMPAVAGTGAGASELTGDNTLRALMPQKLLDHIADLGTVLSGERRNVTVLFGDISGFTAMSETMDPEDVRLLMNRCFDGMVAAVNRYDGTVDKFIGDCIMVLFGAPKAHEDDPERAVRCALEMQRYLEEVNKTISRPLGMRVGINTGEVVAGGVGGKGRMDYTVMGDVVNLAQRLESNARVGKILVSRAVQEHTAKTIAFRRLDPVKVKGKKEPVEVFEVDGLRSEEAGAQATFIGRSKELALLQSLLAHSKMGHAAAVLVLGDAGMGKSRLLREAALRASAQGFGVARARAGRYGLPAPLELVRDAVFSLCGGLPKAPADADQKLGTLTRLGIALQDLQRIKHLFGTAPEMSGWEREEAQRLDQAAVLEVFTRAAGEGGLCLLVDDLHLSDGASLALITELLSRYPDKRVAVVGTARPGDTDRLLPGCRRLELGPLSDDEILGVARTRLYGAPLPPEAADTIVKRAEGNPLFAEEVVRGLIDGGALQLSGGSWHAMPSLHTLELPDTLQMLVESRLDRLSPPARQLLRCGAVVGRVFPLELATAALDAPIDVAAAVSECVNRGFLVHAESPPGALQLTQAATHEALLRGITKADRKHAHLKIAEALERGVSYVGDHPAEQMARHFLAAEQLRKAARYLGVAAERLAERHDFAAACDRYRQALAISMREANKAGTLTREAASHLLGLAAKAAEAQLMLAPGHVPQLVDPLLAQIPADRALPERAAVLRQRGLAMLRLSKLAEAQAALEEALACSAGDASPLALAQIQADLASVLEARGDLAAATKRLTEGMRAMAMVGGAERDLMWRFLNQLGRIHLKLRQADRAREFFENARSNAQQCGSVLGESKAVSNLAGAFSAAGDQRGALALMGEAEELANKAGDRLGIARLRFNTGRLMLALGQHDEGVARLQEAMALSTQLGWREGMAAAAQALDVIKAVPRRS